MSGDHNDRDPRLIVVKTLLHVKSAHRRHVQIKYDARGPVRAQGLEKFRPGGERHGAKTGR